MLSFTASVHNGSVLTFTCIGHHVMCGISYTQAVLFELTARPCVFTPYHQLAGARTGNSNQNAARSTTGKHSSTARDGEDDNSSIATDGAATAATGGDTATNNAASSSSVSMHSSSGKQQGEDGEAAPTPDAVDVDEPSGAHPVELRLDLGEDILGVARWSSDTA